jgi:hypothetical protein
LSLNTYQQYFDVDTVQVVDRLRRALSVKNEMFFESDMRPDMYGPFWLCTTLVSPYTLNPKPQIPNPFGSAPLWSVPKP